MTYYLDRSRSRNHFFEVLFLVLSRTFTQGLGFIIEAWMSRSCGSVSNSSPRHFNQKSFWFGNTFSFLSNTPQTANKKFLDFVIAIRAASRYLFLQNSRPTCSSYQKQIKNLTFSPIFFKQLSQQTVSYVFDISPWVNAFFKVCQKIKLAFAFTLASYLPNNAF